MNLNLKNKIIILVSLPTLGLCIFIGLSIFKNYGEYQDANEAVQLVKYSNATSKLIHQLQIERGKSAIFLGGKITKEALDQQREIVIKASLVFDNNFPQNKLGNNFLKFKRDSKNALLEARKVVDSQGIPAEATRMFSLGISRLIASEIYAAHTAKALGNEKKLLSATILDIAKENAGKLRATLTNAISADKELTPQQTHAISSLLSGVLENMTSPTLLISEKSKKDLDDFKESANWKSAHATTMKVLDNAAKGSFGLQANEFFTSISIAIDQLGSIIFSEQDAISKLILEKKESVVKDLTFTIILNILFILFIIGFSLYLIRSITRPIQHLVDRLNSSSSEVKNSSDQVSLSSEQLSSNSIKQASSLQEAVASLEEITQMIARTADNANISQLSSTNSFKLAQDGRGIVLELNESINEISSSNELIKEKVFQSNIELGEISKIISEIGTKTKVINDIVFQTKLLSFNASVEAARAGEQGKGFAVVAEEVGKLAQVSGGAAKEISEVLNKSLELVDKTIEKSKREIILIMEQSNHTVQNGSVIAKRCGESLEGIVEKVQEVNRLVEEIAIASNEQSQGMGQIAIAMNELDHATNSNSTSATKTAEFGILLKKQSDELNSSIAELTKIIYG